MKKPFAIALAISIPLVAMAANVNISQDNFKENWPLTIAGGTLRCEPVVGNVRGQLVTFSSGGKTYALNGTARGHAKKRGWSEIDLVWRDNPAIPGAKLSIGPLIDRGLALCK